MANKNLFKSAGKSASKSPSKASKNPRARKLVTKPVVVTKPNATNNAGGKAYNFEKKHCLAQIAATNCFNGTFYASADANLKLAKDAALALKGDPEFIAKVACYSRDKGYMKDMPAFLTVALADFDKQLFRQVFRKVIDNGKMLRNVIQMARSGAVTGKKFNMSAGTFRHAIQEWFNTKGPWALFKASIGNDPSMRDILRMARPAPRDQNGEYSAEKAALFAYLMDCEFKDGEYLVYRGKGRERQVAFRHSYDNLPEVVRQYEEWKKTKEGPVPDVDFRLLDSLGLGDKEWTTIAENAPWQMTRMNLNTFARHGVFKNKKVTELVAARLKDREQIEKARQFPYQLFVAWRETNENADIPSVIKEALQDAMEIAIDNVPVIPGHGYVCVDTSGSMSSPITGNRAGHSSSVTCVEVAGLIASAVVRKNPSAEIYTFNNSATKVNLNPRDTVITNTQKLAKAGGGTNISAPLRDLNAKHKGAKGDWVLYVSDNESWIDSGSGYSYYGTGLAEEWKTFKARNPEAKLVCCDLTPRNSSQIKQQKDVLQVGGFSDQVFNVVASFIEYGDEADHWVSEIEKVSLVD